MGWGGLGNMSQYQASNWQLCYGQPVVDKMGWGGGDEVEKELKRMVVWHQAC